MNLNELWIGDPVEIISNGKKGKFEGIAANGKAKVKVRKAYLEVAANDLRLLSEEPVKKKTTFEEFDFVELPKKKKEKPPVQPFYFDEPSTTAETNEFDFDKSLSFNRELDLHIELHPDYNPRMWVNGELGFQLNKCKKFLKTAIVLRISRVVIIYGKGEGILKSHVMKLLKDFPEVDRISQINMGSCEVWLDYF